MNFDFSAILVILVAVSGLIWLYDLAVLAPRRKQALAAFGPDATEEQQQAVNQPNFAVDFARSLFPIFLIVLVLRAFLVEPFRIPSNSMMPNLLTGDFILVNKYTYGIRLPVLNTKVIELNEPQRGDVVVFRYPKDPSKPFIKRVVGLPGDYIQYDFLSKTLHINGDAIKQKFIGTYQGVGSGSNMTGAEERTEYLAGVDHSILILPGYFPRSLVGPHVLTAQIPEGEYFVLGDNRDNSEDSRYWGTVPEANLIGKAFFIWMHFDFARSGFVEWKRIGSSIF